MTIIVYFDGLCEPRNPGGYACGGWHIAPNPDVPGLGNGLRGNRFYLRGRGATNNVAEYNAALDALRAVYRTGYRGPVVLRGDSQLVIYQCTGKWKCHKPEMQNLLEKLLGAHQHFARVDVEWVPREHNQIADEESRKAYAMAARPSP